MVSMRVDYSPGDFHQIVDSMYARFFKRLIDLVISFCILVCASWLLMIVLIGYLITLGFPILYIQQRIGRNEKLFYIMKFRTLRTNGETVQSRRFLWGDLLRRTSLDELPQLFNVLKGEMSLIGPRALPVEYLPLFSAEQRKRFSVLPGITGWAQVNGRHSISWKKKFELDNYYVDHISFSLDMKILFKTMVLLLSFQPDQSLQEEKFTGHD